MGNDWPVLPILTLPFAVVVIVSLENAMPATEPIGAPAPGDQMAAALGPPGEAVIWVVPEGVVVLLPEFA